MNIELTPDSPFSSLQAGTLAQHIAKRFRRASALCAGLVALAPAALGQTKAHAERKVLIDISEQKVYFQAWSPEKDAYITVKEARVTTGKAHWNSRKEKFEGRRTPLGTFHAGEEGKSRWSNAFQVPMREYIHVTGGIFMHTGKISPSKMRLSHGCIRMHKQTAAWARRWVKRGDPIVIQK